MEVWNSEGGGDMSVSVWARIPYKKRGVGVERGWRERRGKNDAGDRVEILKGSMHNRRWT